MSADNGVYILKTGKQYRVAERQCIEDLWWNESKRCMCDEMQPQKIIEKFGKYKYTTDINTAIYIAEKICENLNICEYGIVFLNARMSWGKIIKAVKGEKNGRTTE